MLKDLPCRLTIPAMYSKIGCHILRFCGTTGLNDVGFAMLNGHAISHAVFSSVRSGTGGQEAVRQVPKSRSCIEQSCRISSVPSNTTYTIGDTTDTLHVDSREE